MASTTLVLSESQSGNINNDQKTSGFPNQRSSAMILDPADVLLDLIGPMLDMDEESDRGKLYPNYAIPNYAEGF